MKKKENNYPCTPTFLAQSMLMQDIQNSIIKLSKNSQTKKKINFQTYHMN